MRVLLVNPRHPTTYWSEDRVMRMIGKKAVEPPLGLLTVAALLPREWDFQLVELRDGEITQETWDWCDLVMVTGMGVQFPSMIEIIKEAGRRGKAVVAGGPAVFHAPREALDAGADIVVRGEAEPAIPLLLEAIAGGKSGIIIETREWADMESVPPPRYDLIDRRTYAGMEVQFSRGCPFQCEFCDITLMLGRRVRTKSPYQILRELQNLYDMGWRKDVLFVDDNFVGNRVKTKALLREMIPWMEERGYPFQFTTQASVDLADDPELLDLLVRAGFCTLFLGIETPDKESLRLSNKTQNLATDLDRACQTLNEAGLLIIAGCIIGFDNERPGADQRLIDFATRHHIPQMFITLLQAGPGTDLWVRLEKEGRLRWTGFDEHMGSQTGLINFVPTRPIGEIVDEFIRLYDVLYEPGLFLKRCFAYFSRMRPSPIRRVFSLPSFWELRAVLITLFRQGVLYPSRGAFWYYLVKAMFRFKRREFELFITTCIMGEHYFEFRNTVREALKTALARKRAFLSSDASIRGAGFSPRSFPDL